MCRQGSLDHAGFQLLKLLLVVGTHPLEQVARRAGFLLVDLGDREPDVDQHPVAGPNAVSIGVEEADVDVAPDPGHVDLGQPIGSVDDLEDLTRYCQAHVATALLAPSSCPQIATYPTALPRQPTGLGRSTTAQEDRGQAGNARYRGPP